MEDLSANIGQEYLPKTIVEVPASELLQDPARVGEVWREESVNYPQFLCQVTERGVFARFFREILDELPLPTMSIESATKQNFVSETQAEKLYTGLSNILADKDYARLVLYLPFEFLPGKSWTPENVQLEQAIKAFKDSYLAAWHGLLSVQDVRANFVDGDVLEEALRTTDLPRVVKAAHLVPELLEHGMLEISEVIDLLASADDRQLRQDISDSLTVLDGGDFIEIEQQKEAAAAPTESTLASVQAGINTMALDLQSTLIDDNLTDRRRTWLKQKQTDEAIASLATQLSNVLLESAVTYDEITSQLPPENKNLAAKVFIEALQTALEQTAMSADDPQAVYDSFKDELHGLWESDNPSLRQPLTTAYRRLYRLGVVSEEQIAELGISLPNLAGPLSENLATIPDEIERLQRITQAIESDPELDTLIYPVVSVYGSRLKGYGEQDSDLDIGIFIKPGTSKEMRANLRQAVAAKLKNEGYHDEPLEFWLDEANGQLTVHDFADGDTHVADSYWTHMLFEASWIGNAEAISELHKRLLPAYFHDPNVQVYGRNARSLYLERMEQDLLQYRLMHKGYARHYPRVSGIDSRHADVIDGNSMFWDSGYRQLATKLFINMVFLPKLS